MSSDRLSHQPIPDAVISVEQLSKCYELYNSPSDRLKQMLWSRLSRKATSKSHYYQAFWALQPMSFDVFQGECVGIVGHNGSGKSTLLQIICGTLQPTAGHVSIKGRVAALLELGSGFNPEFTGKENVYLNAYILGLTEAEIDRRYQAIVEFSEIGDFINQPVKTYSSGMVLRLAFSVIIHVDPDILVVDEALAVGDEKFQRKCFAKLEALRQQQCTILFVSHSASTILELCDRAMILDRGELLNIGPPKTIISHYQKLLYAPENKRLPLREHILSLDLSPPTRFGSEEAVTSTEHEQSATQDDTHSSLSFVSSVANPTPSAKQIIQNTVESELEECFDPNLKPSSTVHYEENSAHIEHPQLKTLEGKSVNTLIQGRTYEFSYQVSFSEPALQVRFGFMIKTLNGLELGGAATASTVKTGFPFIKANTQVIAKFKFTCALNAGVYFLNAGVMGDKDGANTFLHRVLDIGMFKVLVYDHNLTTGIVDFNCEPTTYFNQETAECH